MQRARNGRFSHLWQSHCLHLHIPVYLKTAYLSRGTLPLLAGIASHDTDYNELRQKINEPQVAPNRFLKCNDNKTLDVLLLLGRGFRGAPS